MAKKKKKSVAKRSGKARASKRVTKKVVRRVAKKLAKRPAKKAAAKKTAAKKKPAAKKPAPKNPAAKPAAKAQVHTAGTFCWIDLATTDLDGAKAFYKSLFGWKIEDSPMPAGQPGIYSTASVAKGSVAGLTAPSAEQMGGMPPHWRLYVAVDDVDAAFASATRHGGTGIMPPFDIPEVGRMAAIQDPSGAFLSLWQNDSPHPGFGAVGNKFGTPGQVGTFCWGEIMTRDTGAAESFYTKLFGWKAETSPFDGGEYTEFKVGADSIGGMMKIPDDAPEMPPNWGLYIAVADCDAAVETAKSHGGTLLMGPMDIEETGRFAVLQDPQGAVFSVIKMNPM